YGDINFLNISDLSDSKGLILKTEKTITNEGLTNSSAWIVSKGAISLAMYASVGKVAILGGESSTSQAFFNMIFDDDILRDLIYQILIKAYTFNEWDDLISYGTQPNLNSKKIKNFKTKIPKNKQEQLLIGDFLNNLDLNISGLENKINEYQKIKKAMLQKMFI
ncbi:restriction endonuclease subunit S, partial [Sutterella wadsworthensis]|uniref:restriction endonuclease subunit S n=1 Tax=Sutterella wadsworthensis TaxID=40545 RepID=UPI0032C1B766